MEKIKEQEQKTIKNVLAIERSSVISFQARARERKLERNLDMLCGIARYASCAANTDIKSIKSQLDSINLEKYRGAIVRARSVQYLWGQQQPKRALAAEITNATGKEILEIEYNSQIIKEPDSIKQALFELYKALFQLSKLSCDAQALDLLLKRLPRLNDETTDRLEEPIESLCEQLSQRVGDYESRLMKTDQYSRNSNVEIKGIAPQTDEDLTDVLKKVGNAVGEPILETDIEVCHRVPVSNSEAKNIVVKFVNRKKRNDLLEKVRRRRVSCRDLGFTSCSYVH